MDETTDRPANEEAGETMGGKMSGTRYFISVTVKDENIEDLKIWAKEPLVIPKGEIVEAVKRPLKRRIYDRLVDFLTLCFGYELHPGWYG